MNEMLTAIATLNSLDLEKSIGGFDTKCFKNKDDLVLLGEAQIKFK